jgi:PIN domain nuclease of toxin-antitoxin system
MEESEQLSQQTRAVMTEEAELVAVSVVSIWEIAIKIAAGRLRPPGDIPAAIQRSGLVVLPVQLQHALTAANLPRHHGDPFDRMLVAQAMTEGLILVTRDAKLPLYGVPILAV